jgi:hypothetical protein
MLVIPYPASACQTPAIEPLGFGGHQYNLIPADSIAQFLNYAVQQLFLAGARDDFDAKMRRYQCKLRLQAAVCRRWRIFP